MRKNGHCLLLLVCLTLAVGSGCFEKIGSNLGNGLGSTTDSIGRGLVTGLREELANPATERTVSRLLDSVIVSMTDTLGGKVTMLEDSILSPRVLFWADSLVEVVTGHQMQLNLAKIQATLVGKTKDDVLQMKAALNQLLSAVLSDTTRGKLGLIRDELLGPKTNAALTKIIDTAVAHIVDSSMVRISQGLKNDINPQLKGDVTFLDKYAIGLLITLGVIAAAIILLVWLSRRKYLRMLAIVTKHINDIPDQQVYDLVTSRIQQDTVATGLEPDLRDLLDKNGLLGATSWHKGSPPKTPPTS
jgi:hypothetical protein